MRIYSHMEHIFILLSLQLLAKNNIDIPGYFAMFDQKGLTSGPSHGSGSTVARPDGLGIRHD